MAEKTSKNTVKGSNKRKAPITFAKKPPAPQHGERNTHRLDAVAKPPDIQRLKGVEYFEPPGKRESFYIKPSMND